MPYVLVADDAFPLTSRIMKPFPNRELTVEKRIFNYRLSRARRTIENAFGILANRFRILLTTINLSVDKVEMITLTCCALHNFLLSKNNTPSESDDFQDGRLAEMTANQGPNRSTDEAQVIRESFCDYFNGEGAVPWQNKYI